MNCLSEHTLIKQNILAIFAAVYATRYNKDQVVLIDMNGGGGEQFFNGKRILSSSLIFDKIFNNCKLQFRGFCYEKHPEKYLKLSQAHKKYKSHNFFLFLGDNILASKLQFKNKRILIYYDPRGFSNNELLTIKKLKQKHKKIDILIHISARTLKRLHARKLIKSPLTLLKPFLKRKTYLTRPDPSDPAQWIFLFFTQSEWIIPYFYDVSSAFGKQILSCLKSFTYAHNTARSC